MLLLLLPLLIELDIFLFRVYSPIYGDIFCYKLELYQSLFTFLNSSRIFEKKFAPYNFILCIPSSLFTPCFSLIFFFKNKVPLRTSTVNEGKKNKSSLSQWKGKFERENGNCRKLHQIFTDRWNLAKEIRSQQVVPTQILEIRTEDF